MFYGPIPWTALYSQGQTLMSLYLCLLSYILKLIFDNAHWPKKWLFHSDGQCYLHRVMLFLNITISCSAPQVGAIFASLGDIYQHMEII